MLALAGGNVIVVLSVPASVNELLTVSVFPSVPASVRVLLTVRVLDVVPPATVKPVERAASVRLLTVVGEIADAQAAVPPLTVRIWPVVPMPRRVELFVPLPTIRSPVVVTGDRALNPAAAVVCPVPP